MYAAVVERQSPEQREDFNELLAAEPPSRLELAHRDAALAAIERNRAAALALGGDAE